MRTANPDQIGGLQRELSENLLTLIHIEDAIRYSDSTEFSTFISAEIHKHFDALDQLQPGLGASYKAHLYPDAKVKVEEEEF